MAEDFVLRFLWAISLALTKSEFVHADLVVAIVSPLEIIRRFIWNFFRLENEHLNNCGKSIRKIEVYCCLKFGISKPDDVVFKPKK
jgi:hypothetical protein